MYQTLNQALQQAAQTDRGIYFTNSLQDETFLSYHELYQGALRYLSLLQQQGVQRGDEVVIQIDALPPFLQLYWACLLGGIVPIPLAFADVPDHAQKISSVWPVLASPWLVTDNQETFARLLKHAAQFDPTGQAAQQFETVIFPRALVIADADVAALAEPTVEPVAVSADDIAFIQFSSGSTGSPKGVVLTHHNLLVNIADMQTTFGLTDSDVFLSWKPKSHDFGMIAFHLAPVVAALTQVHIPTKTYVWSPAIWFQAVDKHRASILGSPNFGYQHLLKLYKRRRSQPWQWDLSCVRTIINGAEPISPQLCQAFTDEMAQYGMPAGAMRCAYGLAEASLMVSLCEFDDGVRALYADRCQLNLGDQFQSVDSSDPAAVALVDCGLVFPSMQVRITDGQGQILADGTIGCIEIKGGNVTHGYYRNDAATKRAVNADGWVNTEDLGFIWQGRLVFASRLKELIIIGGVNYFPYDVERAILQVVGDEALNQYIACSLPDEASGTEQLAVFVYYKKDWADFAPVLAQVKEVVEQQFGLTVSYVVPTDKIPKTTSGKVQRFRLRQQFFAGDFDEALQATGQARAQLPASAVSPQPTEPTRPTSLTREADAALQPNATALQAKAQQIRARVRALLQAQVGSRSFDDQQSFFQLGLNSARLLQLQEQLEQEFSLVLDGVDILDHASVEALTLRLLQATPDPASSAPANSSAQANSCTQANSSAVDDGLPADSIAIVAMACRFPGDADTPEKLWQLLQSGTDPVGPLPYERWAADPQKDRPISASGGAFLADIRRFDPHFFGITPKEAQALDPQQRLLLEVCHEAFENAGWAVPALKGSATGVFVGISSAEYAQVSRDLGQLTGPYDSIGNMFNTASGRLSYVFGLEGPSIALDSACASSLVGVHQAVQALQSGNCQQAIVAAVNLILKPDGHLSYSQLNALSPSGRCRSFDDAADGYIRSEGCGAVVLKPLRQALADGDPVLAVIRGCSVNHNGHNGGLTVPSGAAQQRVIRQALTQAQLAIDDIDYLEAHGSGTKLGDPQEAQALAAVFANRQRPLLLGSVKSNLGHLEAAAGMAGLLKVLLSFQHNQIPANLHLHKPNQLINWAGTPLQLTTALTRWPANSANVKTAAITSLGINGSNAHLILQSYPKDSANASNAALPELLTWSAVSPAALQQSLQQLSQQLDHELELQQEQPLAEDNDSALAAFCQASQLRRSQYPARFVCLVRSKTQLQARLQRVLQAQSAASASNLPAMNLLSVNAPLAFVFTGQGAVYPQIAATLYQQLAVFRQAFDQCALLFAEHGLHLPLTAVFSDDAKQALAEPAFSQALSFTVGYALTAVWAALGVRPVAVLGHSFGEFAAAVCAGALSLEQAVALLWQRGELCNRQAAQATALGQDFAMASLLADAAQVSHWCEAVGDVWLAAFNSHANVTIAGRASAVAAVLAKAKAARIFGEMLPQTLAFHTPLLADAAAALTLPPAMGNSTSSAVAFYSTVSGGEVQHSMLGRADYWQRQLQSPVLFADAAAALLQSGVRGVIEIGGNAVLSALLAELASSSSELVLLPSLRDGKDAKLQLQESLAQLYQAGFNPNWRGLWPDASAATVAARQQLPLINTGYARQDCWHNVAILPSSATLLNAQHAASAELTASAQLTGAAQLTASAQAVATSAVNVLSSGVLAKDVFSRDELSSDQLSSDVGAQQLAGSQQQAISDYICALLADVAGFSDNELTADVHFLALGLDSLMLVQLGRRLEREYGVVIALNDFFKDLYTPARLAAYIAATQVKSVQAKSEQGAPVQGQSAQPETLQPLSLQAAPLSAEASQAEPLPAGMSQTVSAHSAGLSAAATPLLNLMQQQLDLMQQQLRVLQPASQQATQSSASTGSAAQQAIAQSNVVPAAQSSAPLVKLAAQQWQLRSLSAQQQGFIDALTERLCRKHAASKAYAKRYNGQLADWLLRAHYLPETAALAYLPVAEQASGSRFIDIDGNEFIDTCLGFTSNLFGHNPDFITEAITQQLAKGMILGPQAEQAGAVAALICELTGVERVAFTNSGTEAVMAALRVARAVTGRRKIVRFTTSYHGTFDGVLAQATLEGTAPMAIGVVPSLVDDTVVLKYGSAQSLAQIAALGSELAAVLVEPVQSRNPALQPVEYLKTLRELTAQHGIALIFDEMVFGFRCHPGGIQQRFGIRADLVTYGKVVGGGMPIGVLAGRAAWLDAIDGGDWLSDARHSDRPAKQTTFFAGTFCKHPLAMAAAHAVLTKLKEDGGALQQQLDRLTADFANEVNAFFASAQVPLKVSYFSSMYRYDLQPSSAPELLSLEADLFFKLLLEQGIYACYVWENRAGAFSTAHSSADVAAIVAAIRQATAQLRAGGFAFRTPTVPGPDKPNGSGAGTEAGTGTDQSRLPLSQSEAVSALSSEERRMFVLSHLPGGELAYRICGGLRWQGKLRLAQLRHALTELVARHPALRTGFIRQNQHGQLQVQRQISDHIDLPLHLLPGAPKHGLMYPKRQALSLTDAPLWRLSVWSNALVQSDSVADAEHWLLLEFSHLIFDGISVSLFIDELLKAYQGSPLPALSVSQQDYVRREQLFMASPQAAQQLQYWQQQFATLPAVLEWPSALQRPAQQDFQGAVVAFNIDAAQFAAIRQQARQLHCTPFVWLFSVYFLLLQKSCRNGSADSLLDVAVGVPVDQRPGAEFAQTLGMFAQTLVVRPNWQALTSFADLVARVADCCQQAYAHSQLPLDVLIDHLHAPRDLSRNALFDSMFIYEQGDARSATLSDARLHTVPVGVEASALDLTLELTAEHAQLTGRLIYATSVLDAATASRLAAQYQALVSSLLASPLQSIESLISLSGAERHWLLHDLNQTAQDFSAALQVDPNVDLYAKPSAALNAEQQAAPVAKATRGRAKRQASEHATLQTTPPAQAVAALPVAASTIQTVPQLFALAAAKAPDAVALRCPDAQQLQLPLTLSYQQLLHSVQALAQQLAALGVGPGDYVALLLPRGPELISAMFAVQWLGAAYVPLDPAYPSLRLQQMLLQSQPKVLVSCQLAPASGASGASGKSGASDANDERDERGDRSISAANLLADLLADYRAAAASQHTRSTMARTPCQLLDLSEVALITADGPKPLLLPVSGADASNQAAYCLFTSGSTGMPKGVLISQSALLNFICSMVERLEWPTAAVTLGLTSVSFDIFALEVYVTLCRAGLTALAGTAVDADEIPAAGTLVLASERQQRDPALLGQLLRTEQINVLQLTGSRLTLLLKTFANQTRQHAGASAAGLAGISHLLVGGEAFPAQHLPLLRAISGLRIFNMYGPTETTVW